MAVSTVRDALSSALTGTSTSQAKNPCCVSMAVRGSSWVRLRRFRPSDITTVMDIAFGPDGNLYVCTAATNYEPALFEGTCVAL